MKPKTLENITATAFLIIGLFLVMLNAVIIIGLGQISAIVSGLGAIPGADAIVGPVTQALTLVNIVAGIGIVAGIVSLITSIALFFDKFE